MVGSAPSIASSVPNDVGFVHDWNRESYWYIHVFQSSEWVRLDFGSTRVEVNGVELWPGAMNAYFPRSYNVAGGDGAFSTRILSKEGQTTAAYAPLQHFNYFVSAYHRYVTLEVTELSTVRMYLAGFYPLVCRLTPPASITYTPSALSLTMNVDSVSLSPSVDGYSNCSISPSLPAGLALRADTCTIEGTPRAALPTTVFTVTSAMATTYYGTITLSVSDCAGTTVVVRRTYGENSMREGFVLAQGEEVVYAEAFNSVQQDNNKRVTRLCVQQDAVTLTLSSQQSRWSAGSFIEVFTESCGHSELLLKTRFDNTLGTPAVHTLHVLSLQKCSAPWYYKMGQLPAGWMTEDLASWSQAAAGSFPSSTNQLQLYRSTFTVSSTEGVAGLRVLLRFKYGVVVWLNGHEVYREGVAGELTAASVSSSMREIADYYAITVPARKVVSAEQEGELLLTEGVNAIAVAVVATSASQTASFFDGDVRLLYASSRVLSAVVTGDQVSGASSSVDEDSATEVTGASCTNSIVFDMEGRREWVSAILLQSSVSARGKEPQHMVVEAKNDESEWTQLGEFSDLQWWVQGQTEEVALVNSQAWRFYRVRNLYASEAACEWSVSRIDLRATDMLSAIAPIAYPTAQLSSYLHIEFAEIYPTAMDFARVSVTPPFPAGIAIDRYSGVIHGTPTTLSARQSHVITAMKRTGGATSFTMTSEVIVCTGGRSLITLTLHSDSDPQSMRYALYRGRDASGVLVASLPSLPSANTLFYYDFCLVHNIYAFVFEGSSMGWASDAGFMLTVDVGTLRFELGQLPMGDGSSATPTVLTAAFSSYLPFQVEYTAWRVWTSFDVPEGWALPSFDDSAWGEAKGTEIGAAEPVTVYARRAFDISGLDDYNVLNVRVRYGGGLLAYFNGRLVARFNLPAVVNDGTPAPTAPNPTECSRVHVVLLNQGAVEGLNVMAFELHRAAQQSAATAVVFDATGVFGVEDCSVVRDSLERVTGTEPAEGSLKAFLDLSPLTMVHLANQEGSRVEWSVENAVPSQFNAYALYAYDTLVNFAYSVYARSEDSEEWLVLDEKPSSFIRAHHRFLQSSTLAIVGFKSFRFVLDAHAAAEPRFSAFVTLNCKVDGDICPGVDEYPSVMEGQLSPAFCPYGYSGYAYRVCRNGRLGDVLLDRCTMRVPESLSYGMNELEFVKGVMNTSPEPSFEFIVQEFLVDEQAELPKGVTLDARSGVISGVPEEARNRTEYTIYGRNANGAASVVVAITVREPFCAEDGVFPATEIGVTQSFACSRNGAYIGTLKRECRLGIKDGEWGKERGLCLPVGVVVALVVIVLLVVGAAAWFFLFLRQKRRKSVKASPGKKKLEKKEATSRNQRGVHV